MSNKQTETDKKVSDKKDVSIKAARKAERDATRAAKKADKPQVDIRNKKLKRFSALSIVMAIAIVIVLNLFLESALGDKLSFDFTSNQLMSVGEVSEELLANLEEDVRLVVLADEADFEYNYSFMPALLKEYVDKSNGRLTLDYINPVTVPTIYDELDPNGLNDLTAGQLVVTNPSNGRLRTLTSTDFYKTEFDSTTYQTKTTGYTAESSISGAINYVTLEHIPTVYTLTGHGEATVETDFTVLNSLLAYNGFDLETLNLATAGQVPAEATIVAMLAPEHDLTANEAEALLAYMMKGGAFLFAAGPFSTTEMPNLNYVFSEYNIRLDNNRVRENNVSLYFPENPTMMAVTAPANGISSSTYEGQTLMIDSHSVVALNNTIDWIEVSPLLQTSSQGALEINGLADDLSVEGVQTVGLMVENSGFVDGSSVTKKARMVALGSASLFADSTFSQTGFQSWYNYTLTYNMMNWLANEEANANTLIIRDKDLVSYNLTGVTSQTPLTVSIVLASVIIPLFFVVTAIVIYRRRKHL